MENEKKTIELTPNKDVLIIHRNSFQKTLLGTVLDLKRHEIIIVDDPKFQRQDKNTGKFVDIEDLIKGYQNTIANAISYLKIIDEMLAMDKDGKLGEAWAEFEEDFEEEAQAEEAAEEVEEEVEVEKEEEVKE